jgi:hypothetical protein
MKKITLFGIALLLTSCNTVKNYYQVYKTQSETVKPSGNVIAFEDENCKISYNLWSNTGDAGFTFYNKTNETVQVLLDQSYYVINDYAYDYFQNRVFISTEKSTLVNTNSSGFAILGRFSYGFSSANTQTVNHTEGKEITEPRTIAIPPKTAKNISEFNINQTVFRDCDLLRFPTSKQTSHKTFSKATTPLKFYNSITYKVSDKTNIVNNDFYVSEITNLAENDIVKQIRNKFCDQKGGAMQSVFTQNAPDKFYLKYTKTQLDSWKY